MNRDQIRECLAQAYCDKSNSKKVVDPELIESMVDLLCKDSNQQCEKSLRQIQGEIGAWTSRNFGENISKDTGARLESLAPLLGLVEEVGELCHCVLKRHQGIRGYDNDEKFISERDDAVADILVYLCDFSEREGIDLQETLNKVWAKVKDRDWEKNRKDADKVVEQSNVS